MVANIHPTAIIDTNASIHESVTIGAYTIIDGNVKIGENCRIGNHVNITGHTSIGQNNKIFHFASIGECPQDKKYNGEPTKLEIGDNNTIREYCTLNTGTIDGGGITKLGNNNWIMVYTHIGHDCIVGNNTIFANSVALGGHVIVEDWAIVGGGALVHQFATIGDHVMVGGGSIIIQDVPPYTMAAGNYAQPKGINSEGLKRRGFTNEQITNIKRAYKLLYRSGLSYSDSKTAIAELALSQPELTVFNKFFEQSKRGIIR